jgi:hypothetical protein
VRIKLFEQFTGDRDTIALVKLIDNDGKVIDKKGVSYEERGVYDEQQRNDYMGGVSADGLIIGVTGGYIKEGSPLAKQRPELLKSGVALNNRNEMFDMVAGAKYEGQKEFKNLGKFNR